MRFEAVSGRSSLGQLLPPLLLFLVLLARSGAVLEAGCIVAAVALVFSAGRLVALRLRRREAGTRELRSILTVVFAGVVLWLAWLQAAPMQGYVDRLATLLQSQCRKTGQCPAHIAGWRAAPGGSEAVMGGRVRFRLAYGSDGRTFRLCWVTAFDGCRVATGGVDAPLRPMPRWPLVDAGSAR